MSTNKSNKPHQYCPFMGRPKKDSAKSAPVAPQVNAENPEQNDREVRYVVVRDGHRVSTQEYLTADDPAALKEVEFWKSVEGGHSWGASVKIVKYDNRLHRVFAVS